jgi:hypothetical protein
MSESWSYVQNGKPQGPVTEEELKQLMATGHLGAEDLVWRPGLADWAPAGQFPELLPPPPDLPAQPAPVPAGRNSFEPPRAVVVSMPEPTSLEARAAVAGALEALRATKPWARFMGVLGVVGTVLMILFALLLSVMSQGPFRGMPVPLRVILPVAYLLMGALQIPPVIFLNRYASRIGVLLESHAPDDLAKALDAQKSFWKYLGIFALVMICLYVLVILGVVGAAAYSAVGRRF